MNKWERQPNESAQAFEAKRKYLEMGVGRSNAKVGRELGKSTALMDRWSRQWDWVKAAEDWDNHLAGIDYAAISKRRAKIADDLERMRWELPGHELDDAARLVEVAVKLLSLPHVRMKGKDGKTIAPASAQEFRAAAELIVKADDLRRKALDLPSLIIKQSLAGLSLDQLQMLGAMIFTDGTDEGTDTGGDGAGDSREDGPQSIETNETDSAG